VGLMPANECGAMYTQQPVPDRLKSVIIGVMLQGLAGWHSPLEAACWCRTVQRSFC
jgi:hypothetical protein